jgi:hypothetical protein
MERHENGWMVNDALWGGLLMLAVAAVALWGAAHGTGGQVSVWLFPRLAAVSLALCGLMLVGQGVRAHTRVRIWQDRMHALDVLGFAGAVVAYVALLRTLGFWLVTGLLLGGTAHALGGGAKPGRVWGWLAFGIALGLALDALFVGVFRVPLPGGALWGEGSWRPWVP